MALRPEPLVELLAQAELVVVATVTRVLKVGPTPPVPASSLALPKGSTSVGYVSEAETVELEVQRVLRGDVKVGDKLVAEKPVAPYLLKAGNSGPFMLDKSKVLLGRYGPDSHALAKIETQLSQK